MLGWLFRLKVPIYMEGSIFQHRDVRSRNLGVAKFRSSISFNVGMECQFNVTSVGMLAEARDVYLHSTVNLQDLGYSMLYFTPIN